MVEELISIGLEESEAKVYAALHSLGESGVSGIARSASVTRTLCYPVLRRLVEYGLVQCVSRETSQLRYAPLPMSALVHFVYQKIAYWQLALQKAQILVEQEFSPFARSGGKQDEVYIEGNDLIRRLEEEMRGEQKPLLVLSSSAERSLYVDVHDHVLPNYAGVLCVAASDSDMFHVEHSQKKRIVAPELTQDGIFGEMCIVGSRDIYIFGDTEKVYAKIANSREQSIIRSVIHSLWRNCS
jgi:sugar-specific transcriptional regulator TrmB